MLLSVLLAGCVFAINRPSLSFQFILDDHRFTADPRIQNPDHIGDYFTSFVWAQFIGAQPSFYRPVFLLWLRLNFLVSGLCPRGWHLLSITKHLLVGGLLGLLVWKLLRNSTAALLAAALFVLHPAHTESVNWVTVPDPLMASGVLVALLCYFKFVDAQVKSVLVEKKKPQKRSPSKSRDLPFVWFSVSVAAYLGALLAKETAIVFPLMILALGMRASSARREFKGSESLRSRLGRAIAHTGPFLAVTGIYLLLRLNALQGKLGAATQHLRWTTVVLSWPAVLCFYFKAMLWPIRSYSFADPILVERFSVRGVLFPLVATVVILGVVVLSLYWLRSRVYARLDSRAIAGLDFALLAGFLLLVLPLLPALNLNALNPRDFLHGRYTYLPLAGLMLLVGTAWHLAGRARAALLVASVSVMALFAAGTYSQEGQWRDDVAVFTTAHQLAPHNEPVARNLADTHVRAALLLEEQGRCSEAVPVFREVARNDPQDWYAFAALGYCLVQMNDLVGAEDSLHHAVDISHDPNIVQQWQELRAHIGLTVPAGRH